MSVEPGDARPGGRLWATAAVMGRRASEEPSSTVFVRYRPRAYLQEKLFAVFIGCSLYFCTIARLHQAISPSVKTCSCFCGAHSALAEWCIHSRFPLSQPFGYAALRTLTKRDALLPALTHTA